MKGINKFLSVLLAACLVLSCMAVTAAAANEVVESALTVGSKYPTVSGNNAATCYGEVTLDVDGTVSDQGALTYYTSYGLADGVDYGYLPPVVDRNSDPDVVDVSVRAVGSELQVTFTGLADGTSTVRILYTAQTQVNPGQIHSGTYGVANGYLIYTVTVGTGVNTPVEPTPGGDSEYEGWIAIHNEEELMAVANDLTAKYYLANDITITSSNWEPLGWTDSADVPFTGYFYGNGHTISGLVADWEGTYVGLFAINEGTIQNLYIQENGIAGSAYVGVVCGENRGLIDFVHVSGYGIVADSTSTKGAPAGGITGTNAAGGMITRCSADITNVCSYNYSGGIAGQNFGTVTTSKSTSNVNNDLTTQSYSRYFAGGLIGGNVGTVSDCYTDDGRVSATSRCGGFIGWTNSNSTVSNCYSNSLLGFFREYYSADIGYRSGTVDNCYCGNTTYTSQFTYANSWTVIQNGLYDNGNWALDTSNPVRLIWEVEGWDEEDSPLPDTQEETFTVAYEEGEVQIGDIVALPDDKMVAAGSTFVLEEPTRTNDQNWVYAFTGWECSDGEHYEAGEEYTVTDNVTFTATWRLKSVDGDESWTYLDAMTIMDWLAGSIELTDEQKEVADYDGDDIVNYLDAMLIMDTLAGNVVEAK